MTTIRRTLANLLVPAIVYAQPVTPVLGDICRNADGDLCAVERIGWVNGEVSPFVGHDVLQAYVFGFYADGSCWVDWLNLHTLSTEAVTAADEARFCAFVKADLASMRRSFTVVDAACICDEAV